MKQYLQQRLNLGKYSPRPLQIPDTAPYHNLSGWDDYALGDHLIFSVRRNRYVKSNFPELPRIHDFYELLIPVSGEVDYVCENEQISLEPPSVVWFLPGRHHTGRLRRACDYERYVFYFRPEAFGEGGTDGSLLGFTRRTEGFALRLDDRSQRILLELLSSLEKECRDARNLLVARALTVQIFALIDRCETEISPSSALPEKVVEIRKYIDENFRTIPSVSHLARQFFYSREHLARLFRRSYNTSVSSYLIRCRLRAGAEALSRGSTVTQAAFDCGFESISAFTSAFRKEYGIPPSQYKKR